MTKENERLSMIAEIIYLREYNKNSSEGYSIKFEQERCYE